jgi:hypothetical protein
MGMEAHALLGRDRITVPGQPKKKVKKIQSQGTSWLWWCLPVIPAIQEEGPVLPQTKAGDPI